jgi:hypothetical protein
MFVNDESDSKEWTILRSNQLLGCVARDIRELQEFQAELPIPRQPLRTWCPACMSIALCCRHVNNLQKDKHLKKWKFLFSDMSRRVF